MNGIEHLEWDSDFFGKKIGKLICNENITSPDSVAMSDYDLLYIFSANQLPNDWQPLLMDIKVNSSLKYTADLNYLSNINIVEITATQRIEELKPLISLNGHYSRFYLDQNLKPQYENLYQKWGEKCFNFDTNRTWFYIEEDVLAGFITIDVKNKGQVELCSIRPEHRGQGIARKLWVHAFNEISKDKPHTFHISFQSKNTIAKNLYESLGFEPYETWYIYHLWR